MLGPQSSALLTFSLCHKVQVFTWGIKMTQESKTGKLLRVFFLLLGLMMVGALFIPPAWCQTYVSGKVITSDGMAVASGAVALEKGELHNNAFLVGGAIGPDGTFKIPLPSGGPWGLHVYSENYIYFPLQIQVRDGMDNEVPVILPVDGDSGDDPNISNIRFSKISDQVFTITMQVDDPNNNLGPQMVAIDTKRFKSYRLLPAKGDLKDWKADFPEGKYESPFIPVALDNEDLSDWLFVVADHQCSNGPVYNGLGKSVFKPPTISAEKLACDVPGIWKSNFDKVYQFSSAAPGRFTGEQFEGNLSIEEMTLKGDKLSIDYRFEGNKGNGELRLICQENKVTLKGTFEMGGRSGEWTFAKLKNAKTPQTGEGLFTANCAICHHSDSKQKKVGPGLLGLFKGARLPESGQPVTDEIVRRRIVKGGDKMPPFNHLTDAELSALVDYLKSL
jgi:mono/diheme cytochrome c family protein